MSDLRVGLAVYRAPFARAIATARGLWTEREGAWIVVGDAQGRVGLGEVAPLPAWGTETLDEAIAALQGAVTAGGPDSLSPEAWGLNPASTPAAWAGLELALCDLWSQRAGLPLAAWLAAGNGEVGWAPMAGRLTGPIHHVAVNALLTGKTLDELAQEATEAARAGFVAVKLKVGAGSLEDDVARVRAVREILPDAIALRLDGNGGWSREAATAALEAFKPFDPQYVEQPVAANDLAGLVAVGRDTGVLTAADEAAGSIDAVRDCLAAGVKQLVLKPVALGGLSATRAAIAAAEAAGAGWVMTSALDRGVATAGALHLAAALGTKSAMGLATPGLFEPSAVDGLAIARGLWHVPATPGLGVTVRDAGLAALIAEVRHVA